MYYTGLNRPDVLFPELKTIVWEAAEQHFT